MDAETKKKITQIKLNALAAKHLHVKYRQKLNRYITRVDFLGLGVPFFYFVLRYLGKGTAYQLEIEGVWEVLASLLGVAVIAKFVYRWPDRVEKHSELLGENISLVGQANDLLRQGSASPESMHLFSLLDEKLEKEDLSALKELPEKDKQAAYRSALKELNPGDTSVVCPLCNASPYKFTAGICQTCGNTPIIHQPNAQAN